MSLLRVSTLIPVEADAIADPNGPGNADEIEAVAEMTGWGADEFEYCGGWVSWQTGPNEA